jgi:hypothetical protein
VTTTWERLTYVTPLGVAFVDAATGRRVSDGLAVRVEGAAARPNRVGVFVVPHVAGLAAAERGAGDDAYWSDMPVQRAVRVEVGDPHGRFLPFGFDADVPARGLYALRCGSPLEEVAPIELFSAPTRLVPAGTAVVRAELWDGDADAPAAWALLEVRPPGLPPARGLADARGRATVLFPYPEPTGLDGSPPSPQRRALTAQTWTVELRAFAAPQPEVPVSRPDLCTVLTQPPATLLAGSPPATPVIEATLEYGRELVVRTSSESTLALIPAAA